MTETDKTDAKKTTTASTTKAKTASEGKSPEAKGTATKSTEGKPAASAKAGANKRQATAKAKPATKAASKTGKGAKPKAENGAGRLAGAKSAIDIPLDTLLAAATRVNELVSPITDRIGADSRVNALRNQAEELIKEIETRGNAVRDDAGRRVSAVKDNERLKVLGDRADKVQVDLAKVLESRSARAQELIGQARGQISALRP